MVSHPIGSTESQSPPGGEDAKPPKRRLHYELISCGLGGHVVAGADAAELRAQDAVFAREDPVSHLRWYRCLRCDAWLALPPPAAPARQFPPDRSEIELPLRGRELRDKYVLRLIAVDRALHFLILGILAVAIFAFLSHRTQLRSEFYRVVVALHGAVGGPTSASHSTILGDIRRIFALKHSTLFALGLIVIGYAVLEGVEAVGLWLRRRWAEYLTFIATSLLLIPEVYELSGRISVFKILALVINLAIVVYLLFAKRLFGVRGGGEAERAEVERDREWEALEAVRPPWREARSVAPEGAAEAA